MKINEFPIHVNIANDDLIPIWDVATNSTKHCKASDLKAYLGVPTTTTTEVELTYVSNGDTNGACYYAGTNYNLETWTNPHIAGRAVVSASSIAAGSLSALVDRVPSEFYPAPAANPWIAVTFAPSYSLKLKGYSIRARSGANSSLPRNWQLQGSNNNIDWDVLNIQTANASLTAANIWKHIPVEGVEDDYRILRFYQTGLDSSGGNYLTLGEIEFYGTFILTS